jgi:hypothetical protein
MRRGGIGAVVRLLLVLRMSAGAAGGIARSGAALARRRGANDGC